ncbi:hypothetical protein GCM10018785_04970 [Streptomyces longispororuber]|uniref:MFS transporter n=1 Tax=Streptomyces longispororuber TaxID=68230 RepID=A0A919DF67_9ACTN|nr:MFS transporter [Streptomyces longispororuber]GHE38338.1 hypothetical protein GCM10018785_04970 [Streptomyces longispororuber]
MIFGAVVVAVLSILFVRRERTAARPRVRLALFRNRPYMALTLAGAAANTATVLLLLAVPLALQGQRGLPTPVAGVTFMAPAAAMAVMGPLAGRVPPHAAVRLMLGCLAVGALVLCRLSVAVSLPVFLAVATVGGAALGLANALTLIATQGTWVGRARRKAPVDGVHLDIEP